MKSRNRQVAMGNVPSALSVHDGRKKEERGIVRTTGGKRNPHWILKRPHSPTPAASVYQFLFSVFVYHGRSIKPNA